MPTEIYVPATITVDMGHTLIQAPFFPPIAEDEPLDQQLQDLISTGVLGMRHVLRKLASAQISYPGWDEGNLLCMTEALDQHSARVSVFRKPEGRKMELFAADTDGLVRQVEDRKIPLTTLLPKEQDIFALIARPEGDKLPQLYLAIKQIPSTED